MIEGLDSVSDKVVKRSVALIFLSVNQRNRQQTIKTTKHIHNTTNFSISPKIPFPVHHGLSLSKRGI